MKTSYHSILRRHVGYSADLSTVAVKATADDGKGFVEELRIESLRLHTNHKRGNQRTSKSRQHGDGRVNDWEPTLHGYFQFLVESRAVYASIETVVGTCEGYSPLAELKSSGLERTPALDNDIAWLSVRLARDNPAEAVGPGAEYARHLMRLSKEDIPAFVCHFYNTYFAHSAGGREIGKKVSALLLNNYELKFYKWANLQGSMIHTKDALNRIADKWSKDEKASCLNETAQAFEYSTKILREITETKNT
eukprot:CAMPEP_0183789994 /NCGR_PEP_ID=MMETSP0803_2-20130417/750_1 /TAXON_ID=195967 /ORGANISM="Crustomastix stigmata, Strain CCMP3273" /LENGTH=249 /DNA_ID=CAMNT_0026034181 /DNA_START=210 /DNA_END=959 /DNA_ORIENTATION=-